MSYARSGRYSPPELLASERYESRCGSTVGQSSSQPIDPSSLCVIRECVVARKGPAVPLLTFAAPEPKLPAPAARPGCAHAASNLRVGDPAASDVRSDGAAVENLAGGPGLCMCGLQLAVSFFS